MKPAVGLLNTIPGCSFDKTVKITAAVSEIGCQIRVG